MNNAIDIEKNCPSQTNPAHLFQLLPSVWFYQQRWLDHPPKFWLDSRQPGRDEQELKGPVLCRIHESTSKYSTNGHPSHAKRKSAQKIVQFVPINSLCQTNLNCLRKFWYNAMKQKALTPSCCYKHAKKIKSNVQKLHIIHTFQTHTCVWTINTCTWIAALIEKFVVIIKENVIAIFQNQINCISD